MRKTYQILPFILGIAIALITDAKAFSQQHGFLYIDQNSETHQCGSYSIETDDGCFIMASEADWYFEPGTLRKLSPEGDLLSMITIGETYSCIVGMFPDPEQSDCYYAIGNKKNASDNMELFILHFDSDLNVIRKTDVELPETYMLLDFSRAILEQGQEGSVLYSSLAFNPSSTKAIHLRLAFDGTIEGFAEYPCDYVQEPGFMFHFVDGDCWTYLYGYLSRITDSLSFDLVNEYLMIVHEPVEDTIIWHDVQVYAGLYPTAKCLPDSSFLIADEVKEWLANIFDPWSSEYEDQVAFFKSNFEGEVEKVIVEGSRDTLERPTPHQAIDYRHPDTIYLCAYQDVEPDSWGDIIMGNKIFLKKADHDLNVYWEKSYILGPEHYEPLFMMATKDGGCLITGRIYYDYDMERVDVFALKLNADGTVGTKEVIVEDVRPYTYWPNPVQDELYLQYFQNVKPTQIELYDLQGRLVHTQNNGLESINMKGLSSGTYTMRVSLESGRVFTDMVVKD